MLSLLKKAAILCTITSAYAQEENMENMEEVAQIAIPEEYTIVFETDILVAGRMTPIEVNITTQFAPLGAEQLYKMVKDGVYQDACFFRVVPDFVLQFGIAADPAMNERWSTPIIDDPVEISNTEGTIAFASAGPDTRTTQLFINYQDNKPLDMQGFAPLGQVVSGMDAARAVYNPSPGKPGGVDQQQYERKGNSWLKTKIPKINCITKCYIKGEAE